MPVISAEPRGGRAATRRTRPVDGTSRMRRARSPGLPQKPSLRRPSRRCRRSSPGEHLIRVGQNQRALSRCPVTAGSHSQNHQAPGIQHEWNPYGTPPSGSAPRARSPAPATLRPGALPPARAVDHDHDHESPVRLAAARRCLADDDGAALLMMVTRSQSAEHTPTLFGRLNQPRRRWWCRPASRGSTTGNSRTRPPPGRLLRIGPGRS